MATIYRNLSDEDLIHHIAIKQDHEAFAVLYQRYVHLTLGMCLKFLNNEEAQDAVQNIFLNIWTNSKQYKILNFKFWLIKVIKNHCLQLFRKKGINEVFEELNDTENVELDYNLHLKLNEEQLLTFLNLCLSALRLEQKSCIQDFYLKQQSYEQISEQTGYALKEVKSYIQNGRRNLKLCLKSKMDSY